MMKWILPTLRNVSLLSLFATPWAAAQSVTEVQPLEGVPGAVVLRKNGSWCWYQDDRVIVTRDGTLIYNTIAG